MLLQITPERILLNMIKTGKSSFILAFCMFALTAVILTGCAGGAAGSEATDPADEADVPEIEGQVEFIEEYGHARLDISVDDFSAAGFELGDVVTVNAGSFTGDMPYLNGYYVGKNEYMVRAYPSDTNIALCINYGRFAVDAGVDIGDPVTITLSEKAGELALQQINDLEYTDDREDYETDQIFANFREITAGEIAEGRLYRSASPINNKYGRAAYANALTEEAGIKTAVNLASTDDEILEYAAEQDFNSDYYMRLYDSGKVIALGLPIDYASDEFGEGVARGLTFLSENDGPYLVHCNEGKDRAGFTSMVIEALMGAGVDEIRADYMISYDNYYGVKPGSEKYEMIADNNIDGMMRTVAGLDEGAPLEGTDMKAAAESYLMDHGMSRDAIDTLRAKLR